MNIYCVASLSHLGEYHIRWEESIGAALQGRIELQNDDLAAVGDMFTLDTELDLGMELTHAYLRLIPHLEVISRPGQCKRQATRLMLLLRATDFLQYVDQMVKKRIPELVSSWLMKTAH